MPGEAQLEICMVTVSSDPLPGLDTRAHEKAAGREVGRVLEKIRPKGRDPVVSVRICSGAAMRRLGRRWFGRDSGTNVISFSSPGLAGNIKKLGPVPLRKASLGKYFMGCKGEAYLGDVAIGIERALAESRRAGIDPLERTAQLAFHGLMHILGYAHRNMPIRTRPGRCASRGCR